jgi:hypothetical protein
MDANAEYVCVHCALRAGGLGPCGEAKIQSRCITTVVYDVILQVP